MWKLNEKKSQNMPVLAEQYSFGPAFFAQDAEAGRRDSKA